KPDADDRELFLETLRHAGDHVVHERPRRAGNGARQGAVAAALEAQLPVRLRHVDQRMHVVLQRALRPFDIDVLAGELHFDALRHDHRIFRDSRHRYDTVQMTSPPSPAARAARSVMMPFDVDTMAM